MLVHKGGKIKNWDGSAEMSHLQNCSLKISLKRALGGRVGGQDGCERRIKVFVKINRKIIYIFIFWGGRVGSGGGGGQGRCEQISEVFVNIKN